MTVPLSQVGERQAQLTGQRLKDVPFRGIYHGPLPRAAQTAAVIAASLPGVPVSACDLAGDYLPFAPRTRRASAASCELSRRFLDRGTCRGAEGRRRSAQAIRESGRRAGHIRAARDAQLPHRLACQPGDGRAAMALARPEPDELRADGHRLPARIASGADQLQRRPGTCRPSCAGRGSPSR
jgi:hypothetical protein